MRIRNLTYLLFGLVLCCSSCFKEIDTEPIPRTVEETFTVQQSIRQVQSYYRFYENTVIEVSTAAPASWDLAFESAGDAYRVLTGFSSNSKITKSGIYDISQVSQQMILDFIEDPEVWTFDDPSYINTLDSVSLRDWEDKEVYILNRGSESDNYYAIQFEAMDENSYTFNYARATSLSEVSQATVYRNEGYNYSYYSLHENKNVFVDPLRDEWDLMCTPYVGWWESDPGIYAPFFQSGIMINNEYGVRVAREFDPEIEFADIEFSDISQYVFTDMKGAIGANWKLLGAVGSSNLYTMDTKKKYIMKKYDIDSELMMYFKLQIVDYKLDGEDHHPTIEFKYLGTVGSSL
jgi:hypothetical protein